MTTVTCGFAASARVRKAATAGSAREIIWLRICTSVALRTCCPERERISTSPTRLPMIGLSPTGGDQRRLSGFFACRGVKLQTPHMRWRNYDDEIDPARRERFFLGWSCGGARSSRHRSRGGGLSEEDEHPHVSHHDGAGAKPLRTKTRSLQMSISYVQRVTHITLSAISATLRMAAATAATAQGFALLSPSRRAQWFCTG